MANIPVINPTVNEDKRKRQEEEMVRRSVLVYDLLRNEQPPDGFSQKEILTHISSKYDIAAGKTLQRDVALALRCGLDFGILAKKRNKFRCLFLGKLFREITPSPREKSLPERNSYNFYNKQELPLLNILLLPTNSL